MNSVAVKKIEEGAYFIVDTLGYFNQITPFDLTLALQTVSSVPREIPLVVEVPDSPLPAEREEYV